jgi:hypothetical protein
MCRGRKENGHQRDRLPIWGSLFAVSLNSTINSERVSGLDVTSRPQDNHTKSRQMAFSVAMWVSADDHIAGRRGIANRICS